jgi:hypothetical protein
MSKTRIVTLLALVALFALAAPAQAPAKAVRCDAHHPRECAKLRHRIHALQAAVEWQKRERVAEAADLLAQTRGKQPFAYAAKLAYMACRSFSAYPNRCPPASEMLSVGRCESGLQTHDPNPTSSADGWMQFLDGTWNNSTAGQLGFSRYDVIAMGIATAGIVHHDGSWRQWVCKP